MCLIWSFVALTWEAYMLLTSSSWETSSGRHCVLHIQNVYFTRQRNSQEHKQETESPKVRTRAGDMLWHLEASKVNAVLWSQRYFNWVGLCVRSVYHRINQHLAWHFSWLVWRVEATEEEVLQGTTALRSYWSSSHNTSSNSAKEGETSWARWSFCQDGSTLICIMLVWVLTPNFVNVETYNPKVSNIYFLTTETFKLNKSPAFPEPQ